MDDRLVEFSKIISRPSFICKVFFTQFNIYYMFINRLLENKKDGENLSTF